jgi:hypothetical protein
VAVEESGRTEMARAFPGKQQGLKGLKTAAPRLPRHFFTAIIMRRHTDLGEKTDRRTNSIVTTTAEKGYMAST